MKSRKIVKWITNMNIYIDATIAGTETIRTCHVTETIIQIINKISITTDATKVMEKGISKSKILKSDDACTRENFSKHATQYKYMN
jgi:hypothetical protein